VFWGKKEPRALRVGSRVESRGQESGGKEVGLDHEGVGLSASQKRGPALFMSMIGLVSR